MNHGRLASRAAEGSLRLPAAPLLALPRLNLAAQGRVQTLDSSALGLEPPGCLSTGPARPAPRGARAASLPALLPRRTHWSPAVLFLQLVLEPQLSPASHG